MQISNQAKHQSYKHNKLLLNPRKKQNSGNTITKLIFMQAYSPQLS